MVLKKMTFNSFDSEGCSDLGRNYLYNFHIWRVW